MHTVPVGQGVTEPGPQGFSPRHAPLVEEISFAAACSSFQYVTPSSPQTGAKSRLAGGIGESKGVSPVASSADSGGASLCEASASPASASASMDASSSDMRPQLVAMSKAHAMGGVE